MEGQFLKEIPKFKSPEEELEYLRAHVAKREVELSTNGHEKPHEGAVKELISQYKSVSAKDTLHKDHLLGQKETDQIVLRLRPETHDVVMEELLGLVITKGVRNALSVVDKMNNPHVDDDFHRLLVQYFKNGQMLDLKEGTPLYKSLNMTLFEITLPPPEDESDKSKGFKEFIGAMEQFYAGMSSISEGKNNDKENYFTLEVALGNQSDEVVVYAAIPNKHLSLFEKQILAFYHDAKIKECPDDYNVFNEHGGSVGAYAVLSERGVMPIKTYDNIEHDPMNTILNVFSKLKTAGEGAAIQLLVAPAGNKYIEQFHIILDDVKAGVSVKHADDNFYKFNKAILNVGKEIIFGVKKKSEEKDDRNMKGRRAVDEGAAEKIGNKVKSNIMKANIRVIASGETKERARAILNEIESSFNQFSEAASNSFVFEQISEGNLRSFFHDFSYRTFSDSKLMPLNLKELSSVFHFPVGISSQPQLKEAKAGIAPAPLESVGQEGILLGINSYRGKDTEIRMNREDRMRHFYVIGQTGTGKTNIMLNMVTQDILNGDGCCYIDPHGTDIQTILSRIPKERIDDVIYFDPAYTARPMGLNMLEYDPKYPEQKTFVVNEMMGIFNKLFDMKVGGGAMFEQYFRNSAFLVMEDPESGSTLLEITRVLADKEFRDMKLAKCKNPIIKQFWISAEQTTGDQSLANFVPYISSKFDNFISNDIMRPVVLQQNSVFDFRKIMDEKKILLVNLSKGRLGDINANLIGLVLVGKIQMAALSRVDMFGKPMNDFYLYIDEFQNVTTDSISSILSEARKYRLSLNIAHQYITQLEDNIKNAVFGNVGSIAVFRVSTEDATFLEPKFKPTFTVTDITKLENYNAYMSMLVKGQPVKPFNIKTIAPEVGNPNVVNSLKELSYVKFGRDRAEVESEIMARYNSMQ
ncbi:TraM recognition domain-containing protein [Patescibacteria group bacterium]|nr:TraM recognition domain-containing protein [Patescibacteria group bacterium]